MSSPVHPTRAAIGKAGEMVAQSLLEQQNYRIVDVNVRFGATDGLIGEIDIIAWEGDTLCFIEVKTRQWKSNHLPLLPANSPAESVTPAKQRQIARLALAYANRAGLLEDSDNVPFRFDVVSVIFSPENPNAPRTDLIRGAFFAPDDFDNQ